MFIKFLRLIVDLLLCCPLICQLVFHPRHSHHLSLFHFKLHWCLFHKSFLPYTAGTLQTTFKDFASVSRLLIIGLIFII